MRTLIVYESIYGTTHEVADHIAAGLRTTGEVRVAPTAQANADLVAWADLLVVGGPTHVHGMTGATSRRNAVARASKAGGHQPLDPDAEGPGIREWLEGLAPVQGKPAAAFDTRAKGAAWLTGRASGGIAKGLTRHGYRLVAEPESFLIEGQDGRTQLLEGEVGRAATWGSTLVAA